MTSSPLASFELWTGLFGGLALFLYGMDKMAEALKSVAGDRMKQILGKLTTNRFMGVFTGAAVTAVIQSSSVTTVLGYDPEEMVELVRKQAERALNQGRMTLPQLRTFMRHYEESLRGYTYLKG